MGCAKKVEGREFLFKLALQLGKTIQQLEEEMSYSEYQEWQRYYRIEPFMPDRIEMQLAANNTILSNSVGGKSKLNDFMISGKNNKKTNKVDQAALTKQVKGLFG